MVFSCTLHYAAQSLITFLFKNCNCPKNTPWVHKWSYCLSLMHIKALINTVHIDSKAWTSKIKSSPYPPHKATGGTSPCPWRWGPHIHSYPRPHTARWWGVAERHSCLPHSWAADLHPVSSSGCVVEGWEAHEQPALNTLTCLFLLDLQTSRKI